MFVTIIIEKRKNANNFVMVVVMVMLTITIPWKNANRHVLNQPLVSSFDKYQKKIITRSVSFQINVLKQLKLGPVKANLLDFIMIQLVVNVNRLFMVVVRRIRITLLH